tara:strand:+ start:4570 stop:4821 length:252 start_codon:yes stop_codon:yes gene_type:complete
LISQKRSQKVSIDNLQRVVDKIYDDINEIINSVNQGDTSQLKNTFKGKSGDIRLAKINDGTYEIQGRTDEGWVKADMTFKDVE